MRFSGARCHSANHGAPSVRQGLARSARLAPGRVPQPQPQCRCIGGRFPARPVVNSVSPAQEAPSRALPRQPITQQGVFDLSTGRDYVVLYHSNIEVVCSTEAEIREQIRLTFIHEFGHHFGMDEQQLKDVQPCSTRSDVAPNRDASDFGKLTAGGNAGKPNRRELEGGTVGQSTRDSRDEVANLRTIRNRPAF